jgi:FkbM family methyltransferase
MVPEVRRDLPRYALRHLLYAGNSRRDPTWLDAPQVIELPGADRLSLEVVPRDEIGRFLYLYGVWDLLGTRFVQLFLRPGMTVLDVGANIGYYSLVAGRRVGPGGVVHSFEPHDEIRDRLARNVARNGLQNVLVREEAVTNLTGDVRFYPSAEATNQGISSIIEGQAPHGERRDERQVLVPAIRLDDVVDHLPRQIDLVKLDIEGAERAACEGGERLLSASDAPLVFFESYDFDPTAAVLGEYGFTVRRLSHHWRRGLWLAPHSDDASEGEPNYVAFKKHHEHALTSLMGFPSKQ